MATFTIENVILTGSEFSLNKSAKVVDSGRFDFHVAMTNHSPDANSLMVNMKVDLTAEDDSTHDTVLKIAVTMEGVFKTEQNGDPLDIEYFANVNAPAILYPFVRQHIADLTSKSGQGTILMPPFNFVADYKKKLDAQIAKQDDTAKEQE